MVKVVSRFGPNFESSRRIHRNKKLGSTQELKDVDTSGSQWILPKDLVQNVTFGSFFEDDSAIEVVVAVDVRMEEDGELRGDVDRL